MQRNEAKMIEERDKEREKRFIAGNSENVYGAISRMEACPLGTASI
jgi:hypothetical protein